MTVNILEEENKKESLIKTDKSEKQYNSLESNPEEEKKLRHKGNII